MQWRKPDGSLHKGSKVAELESVARSDAGTWNCTFSYEGKPYSESLHITVTGGSPTFAQHLQQESCSGSKPLVFLSEPAPAPATPQAGGEEPACKDCGFSSRLFGAH